MKSHFWTMVSALIIGFLGGVGTVHMTIAATVAQHTVQITEMKEQSRIEINAIRDRLSGILRIWEANEIAQGQLITLVREQNTIVREQNNLIQQYYFNKKP